MQPTSDTYKALLAAGAPKETQALIYRTASAYNTYTKLQIVSAVSRASMLDQALSIGNCIAKQLHLVLRNYAGFPEIPRMAKIKMRYRLNNGTTYSEWIPKGTYFIDTRDEGNGVLTIEAYDPMLKGEQSFTSSGEQGTWPRTDISIVNEIAARLGVTVDARTVAIINKGFLVQYPGYGDGAYTAREVLGYVGSMYGGNWVITDADELRLIILGDIPAGNTNYLVDQYGDFITMGGYRILVSR